MKLSCSTSIQHVLIMPKLPAGVRVLLIIALIMNSADALTYPEPRRPVSDSELFIGGLQPQFVKSLSRNKYNLQKQENVRHCASEVRCRCFVNKYGAYTADCSNLNLTTAPKFARNVSTVYLQVNHISRFGKFHSAVEYLDMSDNTLDIFNRGQFHGMSKLVYLDLSRNKLHYSSALYTDDVFKGLTALKYLNIKHNNENHQQDDGKQRFPKGIAVIRSLEFLLIDGINQNGFDEEFRNLTNMTTLDMSGGTGMCKLDTVASTFLANVPSVRYLNLSICQIRHIERGAFMQLRKLQTLNISNNEHLTFNVAENVTYDLQFTDIRILDVSKLHCTQGIGTILFKSDLIYLQNTSLTELHVDNNRLNMLELGVIPKLPPTLRLISVRHNKLIGGQYMFEASNLLGLEVFHASYQYSNHLSFHAFTDCNDWRGPKTPYRIYERNRSTFITPRIVVPLIIHFPPKIQQVYYSHSLTDQPTISSCMFSDNNVTHVELQNNYLKSWIGPVKNLNHIKYLDLSNNNCEYVSNIFFQYFGSVETLLLQNNWLGLVLQKDIDGKIFEKLVNLKTLNIFYNHLPTIPGQLLKNQRKLELLDLSNNALYEPGLHFSHMTNLRYLDLSHNALLSLNVSVRNQIDEINNGNVSVNLEGNRLQCACHTLDFLEWLQANREIFTNFEYYMCEFSNGTELTFDNLETAVIQLQKSCTSYLGLLAGTVSAIVFSVCFVVGGMVYRYRWKLRYLYYMAKSRHRGYTPVVHQEDDYIFDAFISYCEADQWFVRNDLLDNLETTSGLRLCLHQRDFIPGQDIAGNITNAIHQSRKTVVILSRAFLQSYWCMYEFNMARMEGIYSRGGNSVLLLVFYEHMLPSDLPLTMMDIIGSKVYIEYPNDEEGNVVFWKKLAESIAH